VDAIADVPVPVNEAVLGYAPGSKEREGIESALERMSGEDPIELTATIDGVNKPASGDAFNVTMPSDHSHILGRSANATRADAIEAIEAALAAAPGWAELGFEQRAAVFLRAADLLAGPWRDTLTPPPCLARARLCSRPKSTPPVS
jgi:1-pyrroline-5-carboxylate dehydrogenase